MHTTLKVNGTAHDVEHDTRSTLLDTLRDDLNLTGTKKGCDHGQCGACTIIVNGKRVNACLCLTAMHDGDEIKTIEGVGTSKELAQIQKNFIECDGFQCGFCTSGQIMSAVAMLDEMKRGDPSYVSSTLSSPSELTDHEIAERMSGNLCRCSAYPFIREAIERSAGGVE